MILYPSVIVHDLAQARVALACGKPLTLVSAPGAAGFAGCQWWRELVNNAGAAAPQTPMIDILDCADASGMAMAAIRSGLCRLVLWPDAPARETIRTIAETHGGFILAAAPEALDMAQRNATRRLNDWLDRTVLAPRDRGRSLS